MHIRVQSLILSGLATLASPSIYAEVSIPHQFAAGDKAVAAEVNENFKVLAEALSTALRLIEQQSDDLANSLVRIEELEAELASLGPGGSSALDDFVEIISDPYVPGGTTVRFTGVNVQIVDGRGQTESTEAPNGLGNLIVGYNEAPTSNFHCSNGWWQIQVDCENNYGVWAQSHKSGSHNLIVGAEHNYSMYGGFVAGFRNTVNSGQATVSGGTENVASGPGTSVSGGLANRAHGHFSSVSGGSNNQATGQRASISGGYVNQATGDMNSISGGFNNVTSNSYSAISGGEGNVASGTRSVVVGGELNEASGAGSVVLGGSTNEASDDNAIAPSP